MSPDRPTRRARGADEQHDSTRLVVVLVPVYTRFFAAADYGLFDLLQVAPSVLVLLAGMQVES